MKEDRQKVYEHPAFDLNSKAPGVGNPGAYVLGATLGAILWACAVAIVGGIAFGIYLLV